MRGRKLTNEEFWRRLMDVNPNVEALDVYMSNTTKMLCRCKNCGHQWSARPSHLLNGVGCPKCNRYKPPKKTHESFIDEVGIANSNIVIFGRYEGFKHKVECGCVVCGNKWSALPHHLLEGQGCPICNTGGVKLKTHNKFIQELNEVNSNIECLDKYIDSKTSIRFKCNVCGYEWCTSPSNIVNNKHGCPECNRHRKTHSEFIIEMHNVNKDVTIMGDYIDSYEKILCKCNICNHEWTAAPNNLLQGKGCPICCMSHGERCIKQYLDEHGIAYTPQKKYDGLTGVNGGLLSFDFYLPTYNLLIEYQGEFHNHTDRLRSEDEFKKQQIHDERKRQYAQLYNIELLEIWYYDFDSIGEILTNRLQNKMIERN